MTNEKIRFHLKHYLVLLSIFAFGLFFFVYFSYNRMVQALCVAGLSLVYFFWGVIHHYLEKDLYLRTVLEYFLVAFLGGILIISLIYRS